MKRLFAYKRLQRASDEAGSGAPRRRFCLSLRSFFRENKSSGKRLVTVKGLIKASAGKAEIVGGTAELVASSLFCGAELIFL